MNKFSVDQSEIIQILDFFKKHDAYFLLIKEILKEAKDSLWKKINIFTNYPNLDDYIDISEKINTRILELFSKIPILFIKNNEEFYSIREHIKDLKRLTENKENYSLELKSKINDLEKREKILNNQVQNMKELGNSNDALKSKINDLENKLSDHNLNYQELKKRFEELKKLFDEKCIKYDNMIKINDDLILKLENKKKKILKIRNENNNLTEIVNQNKKILKQKDKIDAELTNLKVNLKNYSSNTIGTYSFDLKISFIENKFEILKEIKKNSLEKNVPYIKIGILGPTSSGKTFILNKLLNLKHEKQIKEETYGICAKLRNKLLIYDTPGINNVLFKKILQYDEKTINNEKLIINSFIENFIIDNCSFVIIVVEKLTQESYIYLKRMCCKIKENQKIFIIHNFKEFSIEKINYLVNKDITQLFDVSEIKQSELLKYFTENKTKKNNNYVITHFFIGLDWGECKLINNEVFEYLKNSINSSSFKFGKKNPLKEIINYFNNNYSIYLSNKKGNDHEYKLINNEKINSLQIEPNDFILNIL